MVYYLKKVDNIKVNKYIDYNNIVNNTLTSEEENNKRLFDYINASIFELKQNGASLRLINKSIKY